MVEKTTRHVTKFNAQKEVTLFGIAVSLIDIILLTTMGLILALQLQLQFSQKINWDEFFYLSHIYDAQAGRLDKTLQMGHVYLFRWLLLMPGGEIAQITMGRVVMWVAQLGILTLIIKTACRFMPMTYALFAGLCFLGLGFVFVHGTSFRADPLAGLCMMIAIYVLAVSDLKRKDLSILAAALALGAFITIKVILFAPLFAALALWRLFSIADKQSLFMKFTITLLASGAAFLIALLLHRLGLPVIERINNAGSLSSTIETVFLSGGLFPRRGAIEVGFLTGLVPTIMVVIGIVIAIFYVVKGKAKSHHNLIMLAFALPLLTFVFYRNAYPYFYVFIYPSAIILTGYAAYKLKLSALVLATLSTFIFCSTVLLHKTRLDETRAVQAQTLSAVHQIFPEPVSYFDRNGMISSFPKAGFFMSSWGLRNYEISGRRQFVSEMEVKTIPLLIDNSPAISAALLGGATPLFEEDVKALRENYIAHWGHIWVAGKKLSISKSSSGFSILIPGDYTLSASHPISLGGKLYEDGDIITFDRGFYKIGSEVSQDIVLRWGHNLFRPNENPIITPIFGAF